MNAALGMMIFLADMRIDGMRPARSAVYSTPLEHFRS